MFGMKYKYVFVERMLILDEDLSESDIEDIYDSVDSEDSYCFMLIL